MLRLVIILLYLCCSIGLFAQFDPVAEAIKPNVATISSSFTSGNTDQGFGFVVGERNNKLYLATAGHVVQEGGDGVDPDPGKENALSILIRFCGDDQDLVGRILQASISPYDFALLEVDKPAGFVWKTDCLGTRPGLGLTVAYIGKAKACYIPTATTRGTVNRVGLDRLLIDIIGLSRGSSGAPVIGPQGIIGMITNADQASADALSLERLRNEITRDEEFPQRFGLQAGVFATLPSPDIAANNMVKIDGGSYTMGCVPSRDGDCNSDETPSHPVSITGFYLSKYEVTYGQFKTFVESSKYLTDAEKKGCSTVWTGKWEEKKGVTWKCDVAGNLRSSSESEHPVIHVTHNDAVAYCQWLSKQTGKTYRLPTEAEWEYAARGGKQNKGYKYAGNQIGDVAWYYDNANLTTHEVGKLQANSLGLYDLSGNVWEWCADWYDADYYKNIPSADPKGPGTGTYFVLRGGSWNENVSDSRVAKRYNGGFPAVSSDSFGFRVARNLYPW